MVQTVTNKNYNFLLIYLSGFFFPSFSLSFSHLVMNLETGHLC